MTKRGGSRWRTAVMVAGLLIVAGLLGMTGWSLLSGGDLKDKLDNATGWAQFLALLLSLPTAVTPLWLWGRRRSTEQPATESLNTAKEVLAERVKEQWRTEAILRSLDDPDPIPVRWTVTEDAAVMDHPDNLTPESLHLAGSSDDIAALVKQFRALRRRRLVILGDPGAGKTTLAVQLVCHLLDTRTDHPGEPVPVLLSVAGWDTTRFPHLHQWVAERLAQDYPALRATEFGPDMPSRLAAGRHILPVLDGLDELPAPAQANVITALNRFLSRDDQVILTSRTREYADAVDRAGDVLTSALVIQAHPVDRKTAATYLRRCLPPRPGAAWEQILTGLESSDPPSGPPAALADLCTTPLGLWLMRAVYAHRRTDASALLDPDAFPDEAALRAHLLDHLVDALIETREPGTDPAEPFRPRRRHDPARARKWLGYLAHLMTHPRDGSPPTRDFAWWHLARTTGLFTTPTRIVVGLVFGFGAGFISGFVGEPIEGITDGIMNGVTNGLTYGLTYGLAFGLTFVFLAQSWQREKPGFADLHVRGRGLAPSRDLAGKLARGLTAGLKAGLVFGLAMGGVFGIVTGLLVDLVVGVVFGVVSGLSVGLVFGVVVGLVGGLARWLESPAGAERATTPMTSWRADRTLNLIRIAMVGLGGGLAIGLALGLVIGLRGGLAVGLVCGLAGGLVAGRHRAWLAYLVVTHRLAFTGLLPRALMPFLDDAHRLGLLRVTGPTYQFRHAELHDHLAAVYEREYLTAK